MNSAKILNVTIGVAAKNKDGFINDSLVKPARTDKKYHQHIRCDLMVLKWILNSIDKPLRENLKYIRTAKELWYEILKRYGQSNSIEIYHLTQELNATSQSNSSLVEYYGRMNHLWETLDSLDPVPDCSCGKVATCSCSLLKRMHSRGQHAKLIKCFMALNTGYDTVRTQILSMDPVSSISKVLGLLQKIENYKASDVFIPAKKFNNQSTSSSGAKYCSHCEMNNHNLEDCFWVNKYSSCGKTGHSSDKCFLVVGFPKKNGKGKGKRNSTKNGNNTFKKSANAVDVLEDYSPIDGSNENTKTNTSQFVSFDTSVIEGLVTSVVDQVLKRIFDSNQGISSSNFAGMHHAHSAHAFTCLSDWITDTGASDHMTYNIKLLHDIKNLTPLVIIGLPDGTSKTVTVSGNVHLTSDITLKNNLSSKKCVATGKRIGDLYRFQDTFTQSLIKHIAAVVTSLIQSSSVHSSLGLCNKATQNVSLLHSRLGHISMDKLKFAQKVRNANVSNFYCETCILAKHHLLQFLISNSRASYIFELIHMDVWGPYKTPAFSGAKFFLTILEDFSRSTWTIVFQTKDQVPGLVKDFFTYIEKQFTGKIRLIRSDNGSEFLHHACGYLFKERGILH
ncbi:uncharacterized protein LOC141587965 [Silene latifolia]|uniref:uncharacterized protein LOC141587965 n=1 Tax=Silene latifolia TaxID=37657 RepID=UPI003D786E88